MADPEFESVPMSWKFIFGMNSLQYLHKKRHLTEFPESKLLRDPWDSLCPLLSFYTWGSGASLIPAAFCFLNHLLSPIHCLTARDCRFPLNMWQENQLRTLPSSPGLRHSQWQTWKMDMLRWCSSPGCSGWVGWSCPPTTLYSISSMSPVSKL